MFDTVIVSVLNNSAKSPLFTVTERIDLIKYSPEPEEFIVASLSPASVRIVEINKNERTCRVAVAADQLSLAIGKTGQNVRLAAGLTNYHIDIVAE